MVVVLISGSAAGQTVPIDDFSDRIDDGWTHIDSTVGQPWGPGKYDVTAGDYRLQGSGPVPVGVPGGGFLASFWDQSSDDRYSDGFLRAQARLEEDGNYAGLVLRITGDLATGFNGYIFGATTHPEPMFLIERLDFTQAVPLVSTRGTDVYPTIGETWIMEASAVDDILSLRVWRPGEEMPDVPQLVVQDANHSVGKFGLSANINTAPFPEPALVSVTFDDVYFTYSGVPMPGDLDGDKTLTIADMESLRRAVITPPVDVLGFDLTNDAVVTQDDIRVWIENLKSSFYGDTDLDGQFNSQDLVNVFQAGQYEDGLVNNSTWATGDWQIDGEFNSQDLVLAFQGGGYEQGPRDDIAVVPEPNRASQVWFGAVAAVSAAWRRKSS
jgi:hypothetical protein